MQGNLAQQLTYLLDRTDSLGVGCIDENGLLIETKGEHAGKHAELLACELSHYQPKALAHYLNDEVTEQVVMGASYHFYIRWLPENSGLIYVMTHANVQGGVIRQALFETVKLCYLGLQHSASGIAFRERLEQPRQFHSFRLAGHALQRAS